MGKRLLLFIMTVMVLNLVGCQERRIEKRPLLVESDIVKTNRPYDYIEMEKNLYELKERYPDDIEISIIGKSIEKRNLYAVRLGKGTDAVLVGGAFHAREWMTSYLLMSLLENYLQHMEKQAKLKGYNLSEIFEETTLYIVPMMNPDGVDLVIHGPGDRRIQDFVDMNEGSEDFTRWKANINGVDLNRQFNAHWKETESKESPSYENYKGQSFLDQPESKALADFTMEVDPKISVAYHLSGSVIFWYYNQEKGTFKRDYSLAKKLSRITGYKLVEEKDSDSIAAGFKDWFVKAYARPGFTIEIGHKRYDEIIVEDLDRFLMENEEVLLYLSRKAIKLK